MPASVLLLISAAIFLKIAADDLHRRHISNILLLALLAAFLAGALGNGMVAASSSWLLQLAWAALGLLIFGAFHVARGMAAGDVKLAGVVFLWAPPDRWISTLLMIALAGLTLALLAHRKSAKQANAKRVSVPYGTALSLGGVWACLGWL